MTGSDVADEALSRVFGVRRGVVTEFDDGVGAGAVSDDETGHRWYFHCTRIGDGSRHVDVGETVTFRVLPQPTGIEAVDVNPVP